MGDAAFFVEGDSVPALGGALVVQSTDPAKTRTAIAKIKRLFSAFGGGARAGARGRVGGFSMDLGNGASKPLLVGLAGSRFVIAYGAKAFHDAINPSSTLSSNSTFEGARACSAAARSRASSSTVPRRAVHHAGGGRRPQLPAGQALPRRVHRIIGGGSGDRKAEVAIGLK